MTKRAMAVLFACLAIAAVVAGCGGGGDSTSSGGDSSEASGEAPTKVVFIKEADAICKASDTKLLQEVNEFGEENGLSENKEPTEAQTIELYEDIVLPNFTIQREKIAELTPPAGDEDTVGEIVDALNSGIEAAEDDPQQLIEGENPLADAGAKAKAYGLKVCGAE